VDDLKENGVAVIDEIEAVKRETEDALRNETGDVVHSVGKITHKDVFGPLHQYFSKKISILNTVIHTLTMMNMKKLQAGIAYVNDCKRLCMQAYTYKTELKIIPKGLRIATAAMPANS
jgi:hypothetical protein